MVHPISATLRPDPAPSQVRSTDPNTVISSFHRFQRLVLFKVQVLAPSRVPLDENFQRKSLQKLTQVIAADWTSSRASTLAMSCPI